MASWSWLPVGGDWTYINNVMKLYEDHGIEVVPFSTYLADKPETAVNEYFVKAYDYKKLNKNKNPLSMVRAAKNSIVSAEALRNIDRLLDDHQIDFAHLHIIHHWITPAIIWKLKKRKIPIIWSLHEYKILCPEGSFESNGKVCEKCFGGKFYHCATQRCKKGSFLASAMASLDAYFYHGRKVYDNVDKFLCPSQFLLDKFVQFGFPREKFQLSNLVYDIPLIDRVIATMPAPEQGGDRFVLYVGRIEYNKGIRTLIDAARGTGMKIRIAGTGSALDALKEYVAKEGIDNVSFLGFQHKDDVYKLTREAAFVVCPSEWYENYPYSVIESLLFSKSVVGARIGGIPELVVDGRTGYLHEPGNAEDLRQKMLKLWDAPEEADKLGAEARRYIESRVSFATHWEMLSKVIDNLSIHK